MKNCNNNQNLDTCVSVDNDYWSDQQCKSTWLVMIGPIEDDRRLFIRCGITHAYSCAYDMTYDRIFSHYCNSERVCRVSYILVFGTEKNMYKRGFSISEPIKSYQEDQFQINLDKPNFSNYQSLRHQNLTGDCAII